MLSNNYFDNFSIMCAIMWFHKVDRQKEDPQQEILLDPFMELGRVAFTSVCIGKRNRRC